MEPRSSIRNGFVNPYSMDSHSYAAWRSWGNREAEKQRSRGSRSSAWTKLDIPHARIMHDNHHLHSIVAYQNTNQAVLSRRAT